MRVFFPCTGLGRQRRGFETFTMECAAALADDPRLEITVFSGASLREMTTEVVPNLARDSRAAAWLATLHRRGSYFSEQLTFFLSFLPHVIRQRPDVIYFADLNLGNLCWHWRRVSGQSYRLLFYNGGLTTKPFTRADLVQQLTPMGVDEALARGESAERQVMLPHGVRMQERVPIALVGEARGPLGLPTDRPVILSVGMLDASVKRMDHLVREVARIAAPRPFLVLLGAQSPETAALRRLAHDFLGEENVMLDTVDRGMLSQYYRAADVFALASVREGFGLAYVEALAHGLPIIAHDFPVTRFLLEGCARLDDLTVEGRLAWHLAEQLRHPVTREDRAGRHARAHARFSWSALRDDYAALLQRAATVPMLS